MTAIAMTLAETSASSVPRPATAPFFGRITDVCGRSMTVEIPSRVCSEVDP